MSRFIKAKQSLKHSVIYTDEVGKKFRFSGGTWTWRNHNPGNVVPGHVSKRHNQIGVAGGFAVFPDYDSGHGALLDALNTTFVNMSIDKLVRQYAPPKENNTANYRKFLHDKTGVVDARKIKDFSPEQFEKLWRAIEQMEGSRQGTITEVKQITKIQKNKRRLIVGYYVDSLGWISKETGIQMAEQGELDTVVCVSKTGKIYLRSRPDGFTYDNFENLPVMIAEKVL